MTINKVLWDMMSVMNKIVRAIKNRCQELTLAFCISFMKLVNVLCCV